MSRPILRAKTVGRSAANAAALCAPILLSLVALAAPGVAQAQDCSVSTESGGSLARAKTAFAEQCPGITRRDCDPLGSGGWQCSSQVIGNAAPTVTARSDVPAPDNPERVEAESPAPSERDGLCYSANGRNLDEAIASFASACTGFVRRDCDPLDSGWRCSSGVIGGDAPPVANAPVARAPSVPAVDVPSPVIPTTDDDDDVPAPSSREGDLPASRIGRIGPNDLLVLHYDNCPDRDDGHAIAAGYAVVQELGLGRPLVVNGTCGDRIKNRYQPSSRAVLDAVWGGEWLDAAGSEAGSVSTSADRWATALANGGRVWIAEGGPADFTARVLDRVTSRFPDLDLKRVTVVQHSSGDAFNEAQTARIGTVRRLATYRTIGDGNRGGNGTADFNEQSPSFVRAARASRYASEWNAAFDYLPPDCSSRRESCKLDFSDTVELLWLVGDDSTRTVGDFANRYLD